MKGGKQIYFLIFCIIFANINTVFSQTENNIVEQKYKDVTFEVRYPFIENKETKNSYKHLNRKDWNDNYCLPKQENPISDIIKKALPKEKINTLAKDQKNRLQLSFIFDTKTGKIYHIQFFLRNINLCDDEADFTGISLKDIYEIDCLLRKYIFDVSPCERVKSEYGNVTFPFPFSQLID